MESENRPVLKKALANRSPRSLSIVALLALVPVVLFVLGRSVLAVIAAINVFLIFGSLYLLTAPAEDESHESPDTEADDETAESTV